MRKRLGFCLFVCVLLFLTACKKEAKPETIMIPDLYNMNYLTAIGTLVDAGFEVQIVTHPVESCTDLDKLKVLSYSPSGAQLKGAKITISVCGYKEVNLDWGGKDYVIAFPNDSQDRCGKIERAKQENPAYIPSDKEQAQCDDLKRIMLEYNMNLIVRALSDTMETIKNEVNSGDISVNFFENDRRTFLPLAAQGYLTDLSKYEDDIIAAGRYPMYYNGILYGFAQGPRHYIHGHLGYNKTIYDSLGYTKKLHEMWNDGEFTWDVLKQICANFKANYPISEGYYCITGHVERFTSALLYTNGANLLDNKTYDLKLTTPEVIETLNFLQELVQLGYLYVPKLSAPTVSQYSRESFRTPSYEGKTLFMFENSDWLNDHWLSYGIEEYSGTLLPVGPKYAGNPNWKEYYKIPISYYSIYSIPKGVENVDAAFYAGLQFIIGNQTNEEYFQYRLEKFILGIYTDKDAEEFFLDKAMNSLDWTTENLIMSLQSYNDYYNAFDDIVYKGQNPRAVMENLATVINTELVNIGLKPQE